ncbi:site-specific integrase [Nocardia farcinica]|nr:hypothetical protein [Nocardia farcinica]UEX26266.1 hypothetical protein LMJ57_30405 [Nocardia farcinica]
MRSNATTEGAAARACFCRSCRPDTARAKARAQAMAALRLDDLATVDDSPRVKAALDELAMLAHSGAWTAPTLHRRASDLRMLLATTPQGEQVRLSRIRAELGTVRARVAAQVLAEHGLLIDDTTSRLHRWIERRSTGLPPAFGEDVRAWLTALADGEPRARPRSEATLHAYLSRTVPALEQWSTTRTHLREVTREDVLAVVDQLTGHARVGTLVALRSLFRFAKRRGLVFQNPTSRIHGGTAPARVVLPMSDPEIAEVTATAVAPLQRIAVALVAVYAARPGALRQIQLDDIDMSGRRIRIGAHTHQLTDFTHDAVVTWLRHRHQHWPHTTNPHLLINPQTASGTAPISDYSLTWHLNLRGVDLEHIRADRILHEALATNADPLHLALTFGLSDSTAITYAMNARTLTEDTGDSRS